MYLVVLYFPGEITEEELLSRLQQIKDGPEQLDSNSTSLESGEGTGGKSIRYLLQYIH